ncbi:MAG: hypothetical protein IPQ16_14435 [Geobacteraceae bacterium]|nr:hypothetical protein [Geobacteraceae bacterium]
MIAESVEGTDVRPKAPVQRLCNEIQLFDLCDRETCGSKQGLYCTSTELLNRFEAIAEEDERPAASGYLCDEDDDALPTDDDEYDDSYDDVQFGDERYEEDHEDE